MKDLATTLLNQGGEFRIVKHPRGAFQLMMRIIEKLQWTRFIREDIDLDRRDMPSGVILAENKTSQPTIANKAKEIFPQDTASSRRMVAARVRSCKLPMSPFKKPAGKKKATQGPPIRSAFNP